MEAPEKVYLITEEQRDKALNYMQSDLPRFSREGAYSVHERVSNYIEELRALPEAPDSDLSEALAILRVAMDTEVDDVTMIANAIGRMTRAESKLTEKEKELQRARDVVRVYHEWLEDVHRGRTTRGLDHKAGEYEMCSGCAALTTKPEDTNAK